MNPNDPTSDSYESIPLPPPRKNQGPMESAGISMPESWNDEISTSLDGTESSKTVTATPNSDDEPVQAFVSRPAKRTLSEKIRRFRKEHPVIFYGSLSVLTIGFIAAFSGLTYLSQFSRKADSMDLREMSSLEVGSLALDRNGDPIGRISMQDRLLVTLDQIPQNLIDALIATEDSRFYEHNGFDLRGMGRAAIANFKAGGIRQGGSTITQQLARHAFDLEGRTFDRKFTEIFLANRIEESYSKDEILELYFNRIYLGSGFWGVGSAARGYFGKEIKDLTVAESATLCALIKSPGRFSPFRDAEASVAARNRTLARMKDLEMISPDEYVELTALPNVALKEAQSPERPHFLLTQIREKALDLLDGRRSLDELVITTTVDQSIQEQAMETVDRILQEIESRENYSHPVPWDAEDGDSETVRGSPYLQAAVIAIENRTGQIITSVGGRNYRESQFNRALQAKAPPGSAFLPFVYAAAYELQKISPITTLEDAPLDNRRIMIGGTEGVLGEWAAESTRNAFEGNVSAAYSLAASKNSPTARMALENLTPETVAQFADDLGIGGEYPDYPSVFLGTTPVNLLDLVRAYAAFPNGGKIPADVDLISEIRTRDGTVIYQAPGNFQTTVFSEETAANVHASLSKTFTEGTAAAWNRDAASLGGTVAGKSGTSYEFKDNWFIGYNGDYTWGVWVGFDQPQTIYPRAFGSDTAMPIWMELASQLDSKRTILVGEKSAFSREICLKTGCKAGDHCPKTLIRFPSTKLKKFDSNTPLCPQHTSARFRMTDSSNDADDTLRARPIAKPIQPTIPVVSGFDPYQSLNPNQKVNLE